MKRISEIRHKREAQFIKNRYARRAPASLPPLPPLPVCPPPLTHPSPLAPPLPASAPTAPPSSSATASRSKRAPYCSTALSVRPCPTPHPLPLRQPIAPFLARPETPSPTSPVSKKVALQKIAASIKKRKAAESSA